MNGTPSTLGERRGGDHRELVLGVHRFERPARPDKPQSHRSHLFQVAMIEHRHPAVLVGMSVCPPPAGLAGQHQEVDLLGGERRDHLTLPAQHQQRHDRSSPMLVRSGSAAFTVITGAI